MSCWIKSEVQQWLSGWTSVPTGTQELTLPVSITQGTDLPRAKLLLDIGLRSDALPVFADDNRRAHHRLASPMSSTAFSALRKKIEDNPSNPARIVTVRGIGYRFEG